MFDGKCVMQNKTTSKRKKFFFSSFFSHYFGQDVQIQLEEVNGCKG